MKATITSKRKYPDDFINKIIQGDTLTELKKFPDDFVDTIITSPPYWGLRDYGVKGQIGLEKTLDEYINKLLKITKELKRVLKPTGVMFWNHGDCYGGSGYGKGDYRNNNKRSISNPNQYCDKPNPQLGLIAKCLVLQTSPSTLVNFLCPNAIVPQKEKKSY